MSELKRGWWRARLFDLNLGYGGFALSFEQMQQVRDLIATVEGGIERGQHILIDRESALEILNRGTAPEPEWLPVGVAPDREGVWESVSDAAHKWAVESVGSGALWMRKLGGGRSVSAPVARFVHDGMRYRRIGDIPEGEAPESLQSRVDRLAKTVKRSIVEWLPVGEKPNMPGRWQRRCNGIDLGDYVVEQVRGILWFANGPEGLGRWLVGDIDHSDSQWRRIDG